MQDNDIDTYKTALDNVWKDGIVSINEYAMLDVLRDKLNISPEMHLKLEIQARKKYTPDTKIVKEKVAHEKQIQDEPLKEKDLDVPLKTQSPDIPKQKEIKVHPTQYTQPKPIKEETEKQYPCPICNQPLSYIAQYKRWYCYYCRKYA